MGASVQLLHLHLTLTFAFLLPHHVLHALTGELRVHGLLLAGRGRTGHPAGRRALGDDCLGGGAGWGNGVQNVCVQSVPVHLVWRNGGGGAVHVQSLGRQFEHAHGAAHLRWKEPDVVTNVSRLSVCGRPLECYLLVCEHEAQKGCNFNLTK